MICPRCGRTVADGPCLACVASAAPGPDLLAKPPSPRNFRPIIAGIASYLLFSVGLAAFVGHRLIDRIKEYQARFQFAQGRRYLRHVGPVARLDELNGHGRIYLVQMGEHKDPYSLGDFAKWLHDKYSLEVTVLPPTATDRSSWNPSRNQYVAESLYSQMKRDHPDLSADPDAYLIGFTDADIYSNYHLWRSTFTQRDMRRAAIVSSEGMQDSPVCTDPAHESTALGHFYSRLRRILLKSERMQDTPVCTDPAHESTALEHFHSRLRRILLKDVAILYWHLPSNNDPSSLLHDTLDPDLPTEDIYESDLYPARSERGESLGEPCIFFDYSAGQGIKPMPGSLIRGCADAMDPEEDISVERFELDLRLGLLIDKRTDLYLPDTIPIQFQRVTRDGWKGLNPFGISGSDNYDKFLSSADNIQISVVRADGGRSELIRQPRWNSNLSLVKYVDLENTGFYEMRWSATPFEHYDLRRFDGAVETYLPCNSPTVWCYLTGYRNPQGQELRFERGDGRRLMRLESPNQNWVRISYDSVGRIEEVLDSKGRRVRYGYDPENRLISAAYPSGEICYYEYDSTQHLLTFSVAPDSKAKPRVLMRNEYFDGLLVKQTFADGSVYAYNYDRSNGKDISAAKVQATSGRTFSINIGPQYSIVREQPVRPGAGNSSVAQE
jgi:RHS Repeat